MRYCLFRRSASVGFLTLLLLSAGAGADDFYDYQFDPETRIWSIQLLPDQDSYYTLEDSLDLNGFDPFRMTLGRRPRPWTLFSPEGEDSYFLRLRRQSVFEPGDADRDGMDDVWEMQQGLDSLDPSDANYPSRDEPTMTNFGVYQRTYGRAIADRAAIGQEVSIFNFGGPTATREAVSREVSLFNFGSSAAGTEAFSSEVSLYNGETLPPTTISNVSSREVTLYNFGSPLAGTEMVSQEVSLYNGEVIPPTTVTNVSSVEVSLFNFGAPTAPTEIISHELSVFNAQ